MTTRSASSPPPRTTSTATWPTRTSPRGGWRRPWGSASATYPGLRLPHAWIGDTLNKASTHDIATGTGFTLFTGINGKPWADDAQRVARALDIELKAVVIGEGLEHQDLYGDWLRQREVEEDGVILVRPDKHIAWRSHRLVEDPEHALTAVLSSILPRGGDDGPEEVARLMAAAKVAVG